MKDEKYNKIAQDVRSSLNNFLMFWVEKGADKEDNILKEIFDDIAFICVDFWQRKELLEKKAGIENNYNDTKENKNE